MIIFKLFLKNKKVKIMKKLLILPFIIFKFSYSLEITEYLYEPTALDLNNSTIVINNAENDREYFPNNEVFLHNAAPSVVLNNFVNSRNGVQVMKEFSNWDANYWTGLHGATEQWGFAENSSSIVEYGATSLQVKNKQTSMFLNTFSHNLVTQNTATSIQYVVGWRGSENLGADLWNTKPNDDLCIVAKLDLHSSFVSDNNGDGNAAVSQALITYIFRVKGSDKSFFYNLTLHDSRADWASTDTIMGVDGQDTTMPIVITYAHTNDTNSIYNKSVPYFGLPLQSFTAGTLPSGIKMYGSCITKNHMENIITDIKNIRTDYNIPQFNIENLRLDTVILGPEINTNITKTYHEDGSVNNPGYREDGHMGMNLHELTVYRLGNGSASEEHIPSVPADMLTSNILTDTAILTWKDTSSDEVGFKVYLNGILVTTLPENTTTYTLNNLNANTLYKVQIVSYNINGASVGPITFFTTEDDYGWLIPIYHIILN